MVGLKHNSETEPLHGACYRHTGWGKSFKDIFQDDCSSPVVASSAVKWEWCCFSSSRKHMEVFRWELRCNMT